MANKTVIQMLEEANAAVPRIEPSEALKWAHDENTIFLDVRPAATIEETGTVEGSLLIPRGLLEFKADPTFQMHDSAMDPNKRVVIYCMAGGQAALAGQTLQSLGYKDVYNGGGIQAWADAGAKIVKP